MIKVIANVSKKVPIAGLEYSSQSYSAGMEVEVSDGADLAEIQQRIHSIYQAMEETIELEIRARSEEAPSLNSNTSNNNRQNRLPANYQRNQKQNGNGKKSGTITDAQRKAVWAITHNALGFTDEEMNRFLQDKFGVQDIRNLSVREASEAIELLKERQARAS